jgi:predicted Zn-dependent protease
MTDAELDLQLDILKEDPGGAPLPGVAAELRRRGRGAEAYDLLRRGLSANPRHDDGWLTFAQVALEMNDAVAVLEALERLDADPASNPELARMRIVALAKTGQRTRVRAACNRFLEVQPGDAEVQRTLERLDAPAPRSERTARDPFLSVSRAEAYVEAGRVDKAVRTYRRILHHHPDDSAVERRLFELIETPYDHDWLEDDLSEEILRADLTATGPTPAIHVPGPSIGHPDEETTQPHSVAEIERTLAEIAARRARLLGEEQEAAASASPWDEDDEEMRTVRIVRGSNE